MFRNYAESARVYLPDGLPRTPPYQGTPGFFRLGNLPATLERLSHAGPRDYYEGDIAATIASDIKALGGVLSAQDLRECQARILPATEYNWRGRTLQLTDRAGILAVRATEEHILDVLALKRLLNQIQVEAGLKFKADYHAAAIAAHVTGSYTGMSSARDFFRLEHERNDAEEAAYRRWKNAVRELGLRHSAAVIATVCHDEPPSPRDLPALQDGLEKLVVWYGMRSRNI